MSGTYCEDAARVWREEDDGDLGFAGPGVQEGDGVQQGGLGGEVGRNQHGDGRGGVLKGGLLDVFLQYWVVGGGGQCSV